jgi:hypothetical protein
MAIAPPTKETMDPNWIIEPKGPFRYGIQSSIANARITSAIPQMTIREVLSNAFNESRFAIHHIMDSTGYPFLIFNLIRMISRNTGELEQYDSFSTPDDTS